LVAVLLTASVFVAACSSGSEPASITTEPLPGSTLSLTTLPAEESVAEPSTTTTAPPAAGTTATSAHPGEFASEATFGDFLETSYGLLLVRNPEFVTELGIAPSLGLDNTQLNDLSPDYMAETQTLEIGVLEQLRGFDRESLTPEEQLSYDAYEWFLEHEIQGHRFAFHDYPVHHFLGSYNDNLIRFLTDIHPIESAADAEAYVSRLMQIGRQVDQIIERLKISESMGIIQPEHILAKAIDRLRQEVRNADSRTVAPESLALYRSFETRLTAVDGLSAEQRAELLGDAAAAIDQSFIPAWVRLIEHLEAVRPLASTAPGLSRLPDGDAYYAHLLHLQTSTSFTAEEIHEIGLRQVERVTGEILEAGAAAGYPSTWGVGEILQRAAADAGFFDGDSARGEAEILDYYDDLFGAIEIAIEPVVGMAPEADFTIVPEPLGGGGFYVPASVDGSRAGAFHAGIGGRISRYRLRTIAYHEAVPGHHYQIALAQELDLPSFRRFIHHNGYVEGWALYAERLAHDLGLYADDPFGNLGRLELELLRAARLVADTGIHALGWTREDALDYLVSVFGGPLWSHEVERYVVLPGQATGYMIGLLEILAVRDAARESVGDSFDLSVFHDAVLGHGSLPLEILIPTLEQELLVPPE